MSFELTPDQIDVLKAIDRNDEASVKYPLMILRLKELGYIDYVLDMRRAVWFLTCKGKEAIRVKAATFSETMEILKDG